MDTPEPPTLLQKLQRLRELTQPPDGAPEGAAPFMYFADGLVVDCTDCQAVNVPADLWDVCVLSEPDPERDKEMPYPAYQPLYSVLVWDSTDTTKEEDKLLHREGEDRCYALLDVLAALPEAIAAVAKVEELKGLVGELLAVQTDHDLIDRARAAVRGE